MENEGNNHAYVCEAVFSLIFLRSLVWMCELIPRPSEPRLCIYPTATPPSWRKMDNRLRRQKLGSSGWPPQRHGQRHCEVHCVALSRCRWPDQPISNRNTRKGSIKDEKSTWLPSECAVCLWRIDICDFCSELCHSTARSKNYQGITY